MSSNLTLIVVLTSVIHVVALAVMVWIRVKRQPGEGMTAASGPVSVCVVCGEPATTLGYDGLDPDERYDPHTGRSWSADASRYRPVCPAHEHHTGPDEDAELLRWRQMGPRSRYRQVSSTSSSSASGAARRISTASIRATGAGKLATSLVMPSTVLPPPC